MKELKEKVIGYATFGFVFFLHIYFALLLGTKTAWAQEAAAPTAPPPPAKVEQVEKAKPAPPPKPPKPPKVSDSQISIGIDAKDGITVKGLDKMVEKLEAIDRAHQDEDGDDHEVKIDENGIKIKKTIHRHEDEERDDETLSSRHALVAVLVPIALFGGFFGVIGLLLFLRYKARRDSLDTIKMFLEKGQPIPAELMTTLKMGAGNATSNEWDGYQSHILKGLKPIFWGLGIALFFVFNEFNVTEWFFGVIFILIGAYHITKSHLIQKEKEKNPSPTVVDETTVKVEAPKN